MMIPINKNSTDPFYRYKMPPLRVNREGKQGNPRSLINNFLTISESLKRKPELIKQYFSYQLSVQIKLNEKLVLNGEFTPDSLQNTLYSFIDLLLICSHCENPETAIKITNDPKFLQDEDEESCDDDFSGEMVYLECYACGKKTVINSSHKIIHYILKNPDVIEFDCYKSDELLENNENGTSLSSPLSSGIASDEATLLSQYNNSKDKKAFFEDFFTEILKKSEYEKITLIKPILQEKESQTPFFSVLEKNIVDHNLYSDIGDISSILCRFMKNTDFSYFKTKSKVIQKKESVRIRNMLGNHVDFRD